jgi:hypothetical protein
MAEEAAAAAAGWEGAPRAAHGGGEEGDNPLTGRQRSSRQLSVSNTVRARAGGGGGSGARAGSPSKLWPGGGGGGIGSSGPSVIGRSPPATPLRRRQTVHS